MDHILSSDEIQDARNKISSFSSRIEEIKGHITTIIDLFESDSSVQSFYASGHFGKTNQEELAHIRDAIVRYEEVINGEGQLVDVTMEFLNHQQERVDQ